MSRFRPLLHGLLYGLPAVCFPAAAGLLAGPGALTTLIVALLVAWGLSQGLACLGYLRLGRTSRRGPGAAGAAGRPAGPGWCWCAGDAGGPAGPARAPLVLLFGAGEGAYMLGACVLMVLGAERWLLAALAPGVLGSAVFLVLGRPG